MMAPATKPEIDLHYTSIPGYPLSSYGRNEGKDYLGTNIFHLDPQGFVISLDFAQFLACVSFVPHGRAAVESGLCS